MQGNARVCEVEGSCRYVCICVYTYIVMSCSSVLRADLGRAKVTVCVCTDRALLGGV